MRQCRVLQARRAGSILTYVTREASAARREIGRETPPSVVFCEMSVIFLNKLHIAGLALPQRALFCEYLEYCEYCLSQAYTSRVLIAKYIFLMKNKLGSLNLQLMYVILL